MGRGFHAIRRGGYQPPAFQGNRTHRGMGNRVESRFVGAGSKPARVPRCPDPPGMLNRVEFRPGP